MTTLNQLDQELLAAVLKPFWVWSQTISVQLNKAPPAHLGGTCMAVSAAAEYVLNARKFLNRDWKAVQGKFLKPDGESVGHGWLLGTSEADVMILDLTADQFGVPSPYYGTWPHALYSAEVIDVGIGARNTSKTFYPAIAAELKAAGF